MQVQLTFNFNTCSIIVLRGNLDCDFMVKRINSKEITQKHYGKKIAIGGWIHDLRDLGGLKFVILKDRFGFFQVTMHKSNTPEEVMEKFDEFTKETSLLVEGKLQEAEKARNGYEIIPEKIEIFNKAKAPTPLDTSGKIESDLSVRLDYRFLDLRDPKKLAIFEVRSKAFKLTSEFFDSIGFTCIQTPKLTSAGVESGAELFEVKYFDRPAYLSQSPQIYKQMMVIAGFEKVYELGPVFRAEKSHTTRHLTEFTGIDFEMGFIESMHDIMDVIEDYLKYLIKGLNEECREQLKLFDVSLKVPEEIPRIEMKEAVKLLESKGKKIPKNDDLDPEGEKILGDLIKEKYNEDFVFVLNYPWEKRPFYHMKPENDINGTLSFDLLFRGLEIATGAQREHRYEVLKKQAEEKGINLDEMKNYSVIFQYGSIPHGGVGMGLDRIVEQFLGLDNIREAILLPRDPTRLNP